MALECHPKGHRLRVMGVRIHHWHFGVVALGTGVYLIAKDWTDFTDSVWSLTHG